jgi:hypothetical protein
MLRSRQAGSALARLLQAGALSTSGAHGSRARRSGLGAHATATHQAGIAELSRERARLLDAAGRSALDVSRHGCAAVASASAANALGGVPPLWVGARASRSLASRGPPSRPFATLPSAPARGADRPAPPSPPQRLPLAHAYWARQLSTSSSSQAAKQQQEGKQQVDSLELTEETFSAITDKIPQKPVGVVEGTSYTIIILAAFAVRCAARRMARRLLTGWLSGMAERAD